MDSISTRIGIYGAEGRQSVLVQTGLFMESCPCLRLMSILHDIHGNVAHNGFALSLW